MAPEEPVTSKKQVNIIIGTWQDVRSTRFGKIASDAWLLAVFLEIFIVLFDRFNHGLYKSAQMTTLLGAMYIFLLVAAVGSCLNVYRYICECRETIRKLDLALDKLRIRKIVLEVLSEIMEKDIKKK